MVKRSTLTEAAIVQLQEHTPEKYWVMIETLARFAYDDGYEAGVKTKSHERTAELFLEIVKETQGKALLVTQYQVENEEGQLMEVNYGTGEK